MRASKVNRVFRISAAIFVFGSRSNVQSFQSSLFRTNRSQNLFKNIQTRVISSELHVSSSSDAKPTKQSRRSRKYNKRNRAVTTEQKQVKNPDEVETWRVYGIDVDPDALGTDSTADKRKEKNGALPSERQYLTAPVVSALLSRLGIKDVSAEVGTQSEEDAYSSGNAVKLPRELKDARVVRRSIDARKRRGKASAEPKYAYVVDVDITKGNSRKFRFVSQPGRMERLEKKRKFCRNSRVRRKQYPSIRKQTQNHYRWCRSRWFILCPLFGIIRFLYSNCIGERATS